MFNAFMNKISKMTAQSAELLPDVVLLHFTVVNAYMVGNANSWFLIDTGVKSVEEFIVDTAEKRFGPGIKPKAIILTHGHFDHVGCVENLARNWDIPVYAHALEIPYLIGQKKYPEPNPNADEGLVAKMSPDFPHGGIDLRFRVVALPDDNSIPGMEGWKWIHTPGHTEGHISLYRQSDGTLLVGDAFTTTKQESLLSVLTQREKIKGPPAYLTEDWEKAKNSVAQLRGLNPVLAAPSHGKPMRGEELNEHLTELCKHFDSIAVPERERLENRPPS